MHKGNDGKASLESDIFNGTNKESFKIKKGVVPVGKEMREMSTTTEIPSQVTAGVPNWSAYLLDICRDSISTTYSYMTSKSQSQLLMEAQAKKLDHLSDLYQESIKKSDKLESLVIELQKLTKEKEESYKNLYNKTRESLKSISTENITLHQDYKLCGSQLFDMTEKYDSLQRDFKSHAEYSSGRLEILHNEFAGLSKLLKDNTENHNNFMQLNTIAITQTKDDMSKSIESLKSDHITTSKLLTDKLDLNKTAITANSSLISQNTELIESQLSKDVKQLQMDLKTLSNKQIALISNVNENKTHLKEFKSDINTKLKDMDIKRQDLIKDVELKHDSLHKQLTHIQSDYESMELTLSALPAIRTSIKQLEQKHTELSQLIKESQAKPEAIGPEVVKQTIEAPKKTEIIETRRLSITSIKEEDLESELDFQAGKSIELSQQSSASESLDPLESVDIGEKDNLLDSEPSKDIDPDLIENSEEVKNITSLFNPDSIDDNDIDFEDLNEKLTLSPKKTTDIFDARVSDEDLDNAFE